MSTTTSGANSLTSMLAPMSGAWRKEVVTAWEDLATFAGCDWPASRYLIDSCPVAAMIYDV